VTYLYLSNWGEPHRVYTGRKVHQPAKGDVRFTSEKKWINFYTAAALKILIYEGMILITRKMLEY